MNAILVINTFGIGDVLFTTPLLRHLRQAYPDARIVYMANRRAAPLLSRNQNINEVMVYERDEFYDLYKANRLAYFKRWWALVKEIQLQKFDMVFDFSMNPTFSGIAFFCGVPRRLGFDYRARGRFLTDKIKIKRFEGRHMVEHYLGLLEFIQLRPTPGPMELPLNPADEEWARQWVQARKMASSKLLLAVVPGGGSSWGGQATHKRWPAEKYADLVDKLIAELGATVILMGDAKEEQLCQDIAHRAHRIAKNPALYSAVGETSLTQMAALLKLCRLAIVNDGGPLHIAVASGVPTVGIFGPVDDIVYGPYPRHGHEVVKKGLACQPCYRYFRVPACAHLSCLNDLAVDAVFRKVRLLV